MMEILLWVLIALLLALGFLGCFINKVPGPISVFLALLIAKLGLDMPFSWVTVFIVLALAIASMICSKVLVKLAKKMHEYSKKATWGTTIGSIFGLLCIAATGNSSETWVPIVAFVVGLILLPFLLAFLFELANKNGAAVALKSAGAATCAYLADTFLKMAVFAFAIYSIFMQ